MRPLAPYYPLLQGTHLFAGFSDRELDELLAALPARQKRYRRGETLLMAGYPSDRIGVVLAGEIQAGKGSPAGSLFTVSRMGPGGVFGDVLSGSNTLSPVTVTTPEGCAVLYIPYPQLLEGSGGGWLHRRLLQNLVRVVSDKYFSLDRRIDLLLIRSLRRRIAAYLLDEAAAAGGATFTIPFDRAGLAAYLGCERSALSRELSRMAADGLLETFRSTFRLCDDDGLRRLV